MREREETVRSRARGTQADSNFCYGEGGAGTWSDGKLTTRIGRNRPGTSLSLPLTLTLTLTLSSPAPSRSRFPSPFPALSLCLPFVPPPAPSSL